jgi:lysozyme family protein
VKESFLAGLNMVLEHEGGYVNHPKDPGGRTNMGITQRTYQNFYGRPVTEEEMKTMPRRDAAEIYKSMYWDEVRGDDLPAGVDICVVDWSVNSGVNRACRALQKAVGAYPDGILGPKTMLAVEAQSPDATINKISEAREAFYRGLSIFDTFGRGWLRRNDATRVLSLGLLSPELDGAI